ncbi:MAG: peptidase [Chloroflexi bacterium]|nr:peptidase [Chloroflexota bacterium]
MTTTIRLLMMAMVVAHAECVAAQEPVDRGAITRIREEGFQRSQVMTFAEYMTDVLGPRLTGSPGLRRAEQWAKTTMTGLGLANVTIEPWGEHGVGWTNVYTSLHLLEPSYQPLIGYPLAFTPGTNGKVMGDARIVSIRTEADFAAYRGKLAGAIVLATPPGPVRLRFTPDATRFTAEQLRALEHTTIGAPTGIDSVEYRWDPVIKTYLPTGSAAASSGPPPTDLLKFFKSENVGVVLQAGSGQDGTVIVEGRPGSRQDRSYRAVSESPPIIAVAAEHYNRIYRVAAQGVPARLEIEIRNALDTSVTTADNVTGEITGSDLKDQVVMLGGHLDSWHAATGATDDAAGVAVALEAMRILKTIGVKPRRTIRVALWSYEEGGVVGSRAYVERHFGSAAKPGPDYGKLAAYFNVDNGAGRIRGIYLHGNERVRPIFEAWLSPFADLEATTMTINNEFGVDALAFDQAGLPGFQFIQDPLDYESRTHHSNMDVFDRLPADDMRRNAVILASMVYLAAMRDAPLPRKGR